MKRELKKGDRVVCMYDGGYPTLTTGRVYTVVKDEEPGILDTPYVTTTCNHPKKTVTTHNHRFMLYDGDEDEVTHSKFEQLRELRRSGEI